MVARKPEMLLETNEGMQKLGVNIETGKINIPIRRGAPKME